MEVSTAPQTRLGSNWRGSSLLEPVIPPLTPAESLLHTGTVQTLYLLKTIISLIKKKKNWKHLIENDSYIAYEVTIWWCAVSRFLRHVPVVYVDYPGPASLTQIYGTFNRAMLRLIPSLRTYAEPLTAAMVEFYTMSQVR